MKKSIFWGALVGAIIAFAWCAVSWMVLPWYNTQFKQFKDSEQVADVIRNQVTEHGLYMLPGCCGSCDDPAEEVRWKQNYERGPIMLASIDPKGAKFDMTRNLIIQFVMFFVAAWIVSYLLTQFKPKSTYGERVFYVTMIGLFLAIVSVVPMWSWWRYPTGFVMVSFLDTVITWFLAGLGIAKFAHAPSKKR